MEGIDVSTDRVIDLRDGQLRGVDMRGMRWGSYGAGDGRGVASVTFVRGRGVVDFSGRIQGTFWRRIIVVVAVGIHDGFRARSASCEEW